MSSSSSSSLFPTSTTTTTTASIRRRRRRRSEGESATFSAKRRRRREKKKSESAVFASTTSSLTVTRTKSILFATTSSCVVGGSSDRVGGGTRERNERNDSLLLLRRRDCEERRRLVVASSSKSKSSTSESMMGKVTLLSFLANEFVAPAMTMIALLLNVVAANATARGGGGDIISFAALLASKLALSALLLKIVAGFLLPVDVASCAAYWTFPWRPRSELEDKKVLITGASQGLGEAIAYHVSSFGAKVILASRNVKNLEEVGKKCLENGASAVEIVSFDALKPKSAEALAKAASKAFSSNNDDDNNASNCCCDYAFLCAGASQSASAFDVTESAERELFNLNALSTIQVLKNILPSMIAQNRGRVCVISSMAAICPAPGQSSYAASKAALSKYVDSLRAEIGRTAKNVTLTNCFPGPIATGFNGKKRVVFNATGVNENHPKGVAKGRLPVELVAKMAVKLTAFGAYSVHLAPKLVMFLSRCVHFCPTLAYAVMDKLGPKRARAAKKGESLYELKVKDT